jgi:hypothetical protein
LCFSSAPAADHGDEIADAKGTLFLLLLLLLLTTLSLLVKGAVGITTLPYSYALA